MADIATYARLGLGGLTLALLLKGHKKSAFATYCAGQTTDVIDGWASRKSNEDPNSDHRKKMGRREANIDKVFSALVGVGLVVNGSKPRTTFAAQQLRELTREPQRRFYDRKGLDTRSTRSSKNSTAVLAGADAGSIWLGPGPTSDVLQYIATAAKIGSSLYSPREWRYKKDRQAQAWRVQKQLYQQEVAAA